MNKEQNDATEQGSDSQTSGTKTNALIEAGKRKLADFLKLQADRLTVQQQKLVLLASGILIGAACLFLTIGPFIGKNQNSFSPDTGGIYTVIDQTDSLAISELDYQMLRGFVRTIDSLKYYDPLTYQEAIKGREGLLDSIRLLITTQP